MQRGIAVAVFDIEVNVRIDEELLQNTCQGFVFPVNSQMMESCVSTSI